MLTCERKGSHKMSGILLGNSKFINLALYVKLSNLHLLAFAAFSTKQCSYETLSYTAPHNSPKCSTLLS